MREPRATGRQHVPRQRGPRALPAGGVGHPSVVQAGFVRGPGCGQRQPPVDQRMARARHGAQGDGHLTVVALPEPATPLARHAHRRGPRRGTARGIAHQHTLGVSHVLGDLARQLLASGPSCPRGPAHEALQGQAVLATARRDRCDIFAFHSREQTTERGMGMLREFLAAAGLNTGRHKGGQTRQHLVEDRGGDLTFRQQLLLASGVSRFHPHAPSVHRLWT